MPNEIAEQAEPAAPAPEEVVETTPETTAPAEATGNLEDIDLNDVSPEDAEAFLYQGKALNIPDKPKAEPEPEEVETTPAAEVTEPEAETETPEETEEDDDKPLPGRISTKQFDDQDQRVLKTMHALNHGLKPGDPGRVGIPEVVAMLAAKEGKAATPVTPAEPPSPVEVISEKVTELEASLATLRQQRKEAIENGDSTVDIEDQIENARDLLSEERASFKFEQREAQRQQAEQAAAKVQKANETLSASKAEAIAKYPLIKDPTSLIGRMAAEVIAELKDPDHPDHALYTSTRAGKLIADYAYDRLEQKEGVEVASKFKAPKAAPSAPKTAPVTPKVAQQAPRKVLPAVGSQTTTPPKGIPTAEEILAQIESDPAAAAKFLYGDRTITTLR